jgi:transcriptional regulator with PAS, ATPase and Fis domain
MARPRSPHDEETVDVAQRSPTDPLSLRVLLGDRALSHALPTRGSVVLGRGEDVEVFIEHRSVSRRHARVTIEGAAIVVEDLGSANGTRIAGKSLASGAKVPVRAGDAIEIGDVVVVIQHAKATAVPAGARSSAASTATTLGSSAPMQAVTRLIDRIAPGTISALIVGETGVGKELVAEAIHRRSPRASRPLVRLNCAAVAASLLESEWFGYEKGAFSGANTAKPGLLEMAEGGTVLFDELAEMPIDLQAKLLRVLEDRAVLRVGAVRPRRIDVRFLAATNRDLEAESARGTFRQDLYFRLNGVTIAVPPLRERREEIAALAATFVTEMSREAGRRPPSIDAEALGWLEAYSWPGNVRELRNVIERALLLVDEGGAITTAELPKTLRPGARRPEAIDTADEPAPSRGESLKESVSAMEKQRVLAALAEAAGNQKRAAEILGISRGTLLSRLQAFGIARPRKS